MRRSPGQLAIPLLAGVSLLWAGPAPGGTALSEFVRGAYFPHWNANPSDRMASRDPEPILARLLSEESFRALSPAHQRMLRNLASAPRPEWAPVLPCFSEDMPIETVRAFEALLFPPDKFRQGNRWTTTALSGGGLSQGDPTIVTYSFAPDGTFIASGIGEPAGNSNLFAFLNGIYGNPAAWQAQFHAVFQAWSELIGVTYVYEPNDDGAALFNSPGISGVRGDVRIGGKFIDGESGANTLAYNYFPNNGDMVLDTGNPVFFGNTSGNSLRLRNTVAHEHGHGLGMYHVCPVNQTKLMEPFISTAYDGPRHDDILNGQRHYGDPDEDNDSVATATDLGPLNNQTLTITQRSLDDDGDVDFYAFTVQAGKQVDVTVRPLGAQYLEGAQGTGGCSAGTLFDSTALNDLGFQVRDTNGTTILASANANPAGSPESALNVALPSGAGGYFLYVFAGTNDNVQLYEFDLTVEDQGAAGPTATYSRTSTQTPTHTRTATRTFTRTATATPTRTASPSSTHTESPTATETAVPKPTDNDTDTPTATSTETPTPTWTVTPTRTSSETETQSPSPTITATETHTASATGTASPSPTASATPSPSGSPTESSTNTPSETGTMPPSPSATETASPSPSESRTETHSPTASVTPSASPTDTVTPSVTETATATVSASRTASETPTPSESPSATSPAPTPTESPTETLELKPTEESYDVAPLQLDGMVDSRDLSVWLERISSGTEEAGLLYDLSRFWMSPVD
ncbi:MAG: hypothetical protein GHCLOJNM_01608 [bacterium]|nr:hypothetical protein [bacterium]